MKDISINEQEMISKVISELKQHHLVDMHPKVTIIYNAESDDLVYTVQEVAKKLKVNPNMVYSLIDHGLLPCLNFGIKKIRRAALLAFLEKYEDIDLSDFMTLPTVKHKDT